MVERLIDAEALRDTLYEADAITMRGVAIINQFPTTEAKPVVHAHWEKENDLFFVCSNCGTTCPYNFESNFITHWMCKYCPICGAQMDEKESD